MTIPSNVKTYYNYKPSASQAFGAPRGTTRKHRGTDFSHSTRSGTAVPALLGGTVKQKRTPSTQHGFGYQIVTEVTFQGRKYDVSYAHGSVAQKLAVGATFKQGDYISTEGTSGATSGPCMHLEVLDVARGVYIDPMILVKAVLAEQAPASTSTKSDLRTLGIQKSLNLLGYKLKEDGIMGPLTIAAIKDFQKSQGLTPDGIWGPLTNTARNKLAVKLRPTLRRGSRLPEVKIVQKKLGLIQDGIFGYRTEAAVKRFQKSKGLAQDGVVGPKTWAKLGY